MRPILIVFSASLLATGAGAQTPAAVPGDADPISSVQVRAPLQPQSINEEQALQINGAYAMSNGWRLNVQAEQRYITTRIDKDRPLRLYAVAPYKFVSRDGKVDMEFNRGANGDEVLMGYVPENSLARVEVKSSRLAQR